MNHDKLREDFLDWSGGFPPESEQQIDVYVEHRSPVDMDNAEVTQILTDWLKEESQP